MVCFFQWVEQQHGSRVDTISFTHRIGGCQYGISWIQKPAGPKKFIPPLPMNHHPWLLMTNPHMLQLFYTTHKSSTFLKLEKYKGIQATVFGEFHPYLRENHYRCQITHLCSDHFFYPPTVFNASIIFWVEFNSLNLN